MTSLSSLPVVVKRTSKTILRCPNCNALPLFRKSNDARYKTLLVHESATCPAPYGRVIYHHSQPDAVAKWNTHVVACRAARA